MDVATLQYVIVRTYYWKSLLREASWSQGVFCEYHYQPGRRPRTKEGWHSGYLRRVVAGLHLGRNEEGAANSPAVLEGVYRRGCHRSSHLHFVDLAGMGRGAGEGTRQAESVRVLLHLCRLLPAHHGKDAQQRGVRGRHRSCHTGVTPGLKWDKTG